jgi:hypothetical protein
VNCPAEPTITIIIARERCRLATIRGSLGPGAGPVVNMNVCEGKGDLRHECQQRNQEIPWMPPEWLHNLPH